MKHGGLGDFSVTKQNKANYLASWIDKWGRENI
jgi:hypothetical protein